MKKIYKTDIVKKYIFKEIKDGNIKKGNRLPSCRKIASELSVNKITVNKAYNELEREHKLFSIPRGGFYLVDYEEDLKIVQKQVDFNTVKPDDKLIPYKEFTHVINKAVDQYKNTLFSYGTTSGLSHFRDTLKSMFEKDGIYTTSKNIVVTHGAQQAITLVFQLIFQNNNGKLLVEVPTYNLALAFAKFLKIETIGIERKFNGYDFNELERIFKNENVAAFYIIPRHHNPTGYTLSENSKRKICELCNKYSVLIIEDDYLADLGNENRSMPIYYYDINKSSIYIRSFSKTFMPGIRIGAAVFPESIIKSVVNFKYLSDLSTSKLTQAALDIFIKSGMYEKHIKKVKKSYEIKLAKAKEIFKALSPKELIWHVPKHGIFIWLELPTYVNVMELEKKLYNHGILIKTAEEFFLKEYNTKHTNCLRLCISGVSEKNINSIADVILAIRSFKSS